MEFAEVLCLDALHRRESCGGHFREEFQMPDVKRVATMITSLMSLCGISRGG